VQELVDSGARLKHHRIEEDDPLINISAVAQYKRLSIVANQRRIKRESNNGVRHGTQDDEDYQNEEPLLCVLKMSN
jgi:hypothetical protein